MDFYSVIDNRMSYKKYKNTKVNLDSLDRMVNSAMMSPSWKNKTSYKLIIVEDQAEKNSIADAVMNSDSQAADAIRMAPICCAVVADPKESGKIGNKEFYLVDAAIAMEHFILSAEAEGYGTCWIAALDEGKVKQTLNIPANYEVVAVTPVGEPDEERSHNEKKDVREYVFMNEWDCSFIENDSKLK
jgi:nitroreductase